MLSTIPLKLKEHHLYGSSRLGIINRDMDVDQPRLAVDNGNMHLGDAYLATFTRGEKLFELTNHLGNVLLTVTDAKVPTVLAGSSPATVGSYAVNMVTATDYTPFGMVMLGRNYNTVAATKYRYGFNGKEFDNEPKSLGNQIDYGERMYDNRVGRFLSVDPLTGKYPMLTPYQYGSNNPVWNIDLDGLEGVSFQDVWNGRASVVDWINNPNAWSAGLDNISSYNPMWHGYVRSYEVVTGKDYNTGDTKSRVTSAIEGAGDVMFALTLGKFLKIPNASTPLEMEMAQNAKAVGKALPTPSQEAVKTVEEKSMAKQITPVQQWQAKAGGASVKFQNSGGMFGGNEWLNKGIHANVEGIGRNVEIGFSLNQAGDDIAVKIVNYKGPLSSKETQSILKKGREFLQNKGNLEKLKSWFEAAKGNGNVPESAHGTINKTIEVISKKLE